MPLKLAKLHGEAEIFYSIQGEGIQVGRPSIFVRTSLCNLHCIWCDTDYTWNWVGTPFPHENDVKPAYKKFDKKDWIVTLTTEEIAVRIATFPCKNIILTGGEPMMQQKELLALMAYLKAKDAEYQFEIETNGTLAPTTAFDAFVTQYNVSPKLANSGNPQKLREKSSVYRTFATNEKAWFKFVLSNKNDLEEVKTLISKYNIPSRRVILMPEGSQRISLTKKRQWLIEICKAEGFRFSDRLHVEVWGNKKGV